MSGRKAAKHVILGASKATGMTALGRFLTRGGFNIVGFHGVSLDDEHVRFPTLFISPAAFERRLSFLTRHYQIVTLAEAIRQHQEGRIKPRQVVLTFDDGFYNFLGRAIPLLERYEAPATVYVVTSDVESGEPTTNLLAKDVILSTTRSRASGLPHAPGEEVDLSTDACRQALVARVLRALQQTCVTAGDRMSFCRALASALNVDIERKLRARLWDRLSPAEIREVVRRGFDVQLHTHSHQNVVEHADHVREEVRKNRESLHAMSGTLPVHFCYPLGLWRRSVWNDLSVEGVESAVTTRNGPNYAGTPVLSLRRYLTGEAMSDLEFEFGLSGLRWLSQAVRHPAGRYEPTEKVVRYSQQPDLY